MEKFQKVHYLNYARRRIDGGSICSKNDKAEGDNLCQMIQGRSGSGQLSCCNYRCRLQKKAICSYNDKAEDGNWCHIIQGRSGSGQLLWCDYRYWLRKQYVIIPLPTKLLGLYLFHHGSLSVHLSFCMSEEKWSLHHNSFSFWLTMMIVHTWQLCVGHDPRRTSIDFGVKRSRLQSNLDFKLFSVSER